MDNRLKHILAGAAGLSCFIIYVITLSPSVGFMDSGELAAVVYTFGIPHPTGYPLYLLLGYIVSHLPAGHSIIYKLNLFSSLTAALSVLVFFYTALLMLNIFNEHKKEKKSGNKAKISVNIDSKFLPYIAFISAVCFGLIKTLWSNAVINEVYGLHSLFIMLIIYFSVKIYINLSASPFKYWIILFLLTGLSFSNHLTTIFVLPAVLYLFYLQYRASPGNIKKIITYIVFIVPGFLLYGILITASSAGPFFNWSEPAGLTNLFYHFSGADYSNLLKSGSGIFSKNIKLFGSGFFGEFSVASGIIALIGLVVLYFKKKELFIYFAILIITALAFSLNYAVRDVQNYFLVIYLTVALVLPVGIFSLLKYLAAKLKLASVPVLHVAVIGILLIGTGIAYNYESNNNSSNYAVEDFTLNILNNLEPNAIYITYDWGYVYPAALYYQQAEGKRLDVKFIMIRFLAAPWYLNTLKKYYPDIYSGIAKEAEDYIKAYDPEGTKNSINLVNLVRAFVKNNVNKFPMYVSSDLMYNKDLPDLFTDYGWKPGPLCYKIISRSEGYDNNAAVNSLEFSFRPYKSDNQEKRVIKVSTAGMYFDFAYYHFKNNNKQAALRFLDKSLSFENLPDAVKLKNQLINEQKK